MIYKIEPRCGGITVRDFLRGEANFSRGMLTKLKTSPQGILLNGEPVTVRAVLREGDILNLRTDDGEEEVNKLITPVSLPLDIIYEDGDALVLNKAPEMPTHPSLGHPDDTVANAVCFYYRAQGMSFVFRAVNRLDSGTGGIVLVAKNRPASYAFSRQLAEGAIKKTYIAAACGTLPEEGIIKANIRRRNGSIILREACGPDGSAGAYAETSFTLAACDGVYSEVRVTPKTGRTHQIRVHFAHIGHPLVGDYLYGEENQAGMKRQALHAYKISFISPRSGERIELTAPMPPDLEALIKNIRSHGKLYNG